MRRELREWRRERGSEEAYKRGKLEYKELCIKKKEENEKWEKKAMEVRKENEVRDIVNKERRRRKRK